MADAEILLGILVFLGIVVSLGFLGMETGIESEDYSIEDVNETYESGSMTDNALMLYDYMSSFSTEYQTLAYIIILPLILFGVYLVVKLVWVG